MFSFFYNISLFLLALITLPKLLWQLCIQGKYRQSLKERLGLALPHFSPQKGQEVIWIHAVSMGETRAVIPLFHLLRQSYPNAAIVISTTTETGNREAKRSMADASAHFFLPLDFSWIIRKFMKQIQPNLLILCESDFWYHLLQIAKERGVKTALVNGKVSQRSCQRFQKIPFFTKRIFSQLDLFCIQSAIYCERFRSMGIPQEKIIVTGNLKFDASLQKMQAIELQTLCEKLRIEKTDRILVIGSTHSPEEEWLLSALSSIWKKIPHLKVLLVPRHPERFEEVAHLITKRAIPFDRYSKPQKTGERLILIDAMGLLNSCYQLADLALVGGSYVTHVGGHNIFEPVAHHVPVFFGPHLHNQPDLKEWILSANAGLEVPLENLAQTIVDLLENPSLHAQYVAACKNLQTSVTGATQKTFTHLSQLKPQ